MLHILVFMMPRFSKIYCALEHYFEMTRVSEDEKIMIATLYLTDNAKLW